MPDNPRLTRGDLPKAKTGIVHLGPGAFFRAFQAIYTQEAMAAKGGDWGILAVCPRSPNVRDQLAPQGCAYTSVTMAPDGEKREIISSIVDVMVAPEDPGAVIAAMADPGVKIVSLTVTEKGYCHAPATGALLMDHPDIAHDLTSPGAPRSSIGMIVEALAQRHAAGHRPFTVLSCDNLPRNGHLARGVVLEFARARDAALADWIAAEGRFPATMVDRITPATTEDDITRLAKATGTTDLACVFHEPFRQWVIEDDFVDGARPNWDAGGAQFVKDVDAHETMKLRCLNGTHSTLAYLGYLGGLQTISACAADPDYAALCRKLWATEIVPTVPQPEGEDLAAYCDALLERYANPAIQHRTWQIAMDGSQKLPQRLLGTVTDALAAGRDVSGLALAVAGWMRYVGGVDDSGAAIDVRDPLADTLRATSDGADTPEGKVQALLAVTDVFDPALAANPVFSDAVTAAYQALVAKGARVMVADYARG